MKTSKLKSKVESKFDDYSKNFTESLLEFLEKPKKKEAPHDYPSEMSFEYDTHGIFEVSIVNATGFEMKVAYRLKMTTEAIAWLTEHPELPSSGWRGIPFTPRFGPNDEWHFMQRPEHVLMQSVGVKIKLSSKDWLAVRAEILRGFPLIEVDEDSSPVSDTEGG